MKSFFKKFIPAQFVISLALALVCYTVLSLSAGDFHLADAVSGGIGAAIRRSLAYITNPLPVSLAEILVIALVLFMIVLVFVSAFAVRGARGRVRIILHLLAFVFSLYSWYAIAFGASYHTTPVNEKMGFSMTEVDGDSLSSLADYLKDELNSLAPTLTREDGETVMPYDERQMSEKIVSAYDAFLLDYPIFDNFISYVKPVMLSELMAYAGLLGMYTFFTGESNISVVYPDYCIPATATHELAHQRGIAREDEANFLAYTVTSYSDDPYIRYSGYLNLYEYVISALSATDKESASRITSELHETVRGDLKAYSDFYYAHKSTLLRDISTFFNDTYLKANGTVGVVSYGMVVRLSVSYYKALGVIP